MTDKIITIYCFFEELLTALNHRDDPQARLSTAEVMTIAAVAAEFFTGNQQAGNCSVLQAGLGIVDP